MPRVDSTAHCNCWLPPYLILLAVLICSCSCSPLGGQLEAPSASEHQRRQTLSDQAPVRQQHLGPAARSPSAPLQQAPACLAPTQPQPSELLRQPRPLAPRAARLSLVQAAAPAPSALQAPARLLSEHQVAQCLVPLARHHQVSLGPAAAQQPAALSALVLPLQHQVQEALGLLSLAAVPHSPAQASLASSSSSSPNSQAHSASPCPNSSNNSSSR